MVMIPKFNVECFLHYPQESLTLQLFIIYIYLA